MTNKAFLLTKIGLSPYNRLENVVTSAGNTIEAFMDSNMDFSDCLTLCEQTDGCQNIEFCPENKGCVLNDKIITDPSETTTEKGSCFTAYKASQDGTNMFDNFYLGITLYKMKMLL